MITLVYTIVIVIAVLFGVTFSLHNDSIVNVSYLSGVNWQGKVSVLILTTFSLGVLVGWVASLVSSIKARKELGKAKRQIRTLENSSGRPLEGITEYKVAERNCLT